MILIAACLRSQASQGKISEHHAIVVANRRVTVDVKYGSTVDDSGYCELRAPFRGRIHSIRVPLAPRFAYGFGDRRRVVKIPCERVWPETDDPISRPVAILTALKGNRSILLDLTLDEESGVYGYRVVAPFICSFRSDGRIVAKQQIGVTFSDFGSWHRISKSEVAFWDGDLSQWPHRAKHNYAIADLKVGPSGMRVLGFFRTHDIYYDVPDDAYPQPTAIARACDPLGEIGSSWRWWGQSLKGTSLGTSIRHGQRRGPAAGTASVQRAS
jgi:hypothetical protein